MPMRMAGTDGTTIDVYQAVTQMTDESGQSYPLHINTLLDNALGATGYFGAFTANMHTDLADFGGRGRHRGVRSCEGRPDCVGEADAHVARRPQRVDDGSSDLDGQRHQLHRDACCRCDRACS